MVWYYNEYAVNYCAGRGLTLVASVIEGDFKQYKKQAEYIKHAIQELIKKEKVKGFPEVIVSKDLADGLSYLWVKTFYAIDPLSNISDLQHGISLRIER